MVPALRRPKSNCKTPAITTAERNRSKDPKVVIPDNTMAVNPAAGPVTLRLEPLKKPTKIPPITPVIMPEKSGAPLANAIPKQSGNATRKTTSPASRSVLKYFVSNFMLCCKEKVVEC